MDVRLEERPDEDEEHNLPCGALLGRFSSRNQLIVVGEHFEGPARHHYVFLVWLRTVICGHTKA